MQVGVVIAAAGSARRMGLETNKVLLPLAGKPIIAHSIEVFAACDSVREIVIVSRQVDLHAIEEIVIQLELQHKVRIVEGGTERQESVFLGLQALNPETEWVMIHDGARPFITRELIETGLQACQVHNAVGVGIPVQDTIKVVADGIVTDTPPRSELWAMQTPQIFAYPLIYDAHQKAHDEGFVATDDCMLIEWLGLPVHIIEGSYSNRKITTVDDLQQSTKESVPMVGIGYDVHKLVAGRKLILCGVNIPWEKGLLGHSDGDVATHALMDALLGAAGLGDIGHLFPDTDPNFKDAISVKLLEHVIQELKSKGLQVGNADLIIITEQPKLAPYRATMRNKLASLLEIPHTKMNIKATTSEGLGFCGRGEGIAAQAIVSLVRAQH